MDLSEKRVEICEVGPRDGLQNLNRKFTVTERVEMINMLINAGATRIEAGSFVNAEKVPNMDDFEKVLDCINRRKGVTICGLTLNEKGVQRALSHGGVDEIRYVLVASETFSHINQGTSISKSIQMLKNTSSAIKKENKKLSVVIAAAFGCPYEGQVKQSKVLELVETSIHCHADEVVLGDTIGVGVPNQVVSFSKGLKPLVGDKAFGFHFHNTRNTGYANAFAAVSSGAKILDSSIGGIGGCPFVPKATGNIATEDLLYLLTNCGYSLDLDELKLLDIVGWLTNLVPNSVTGQLYQSGYIPTKKV